MYEDSTDSKTSERTVFVTSKIYVIYNISRF